MQARAAELSQIVESSCQQVVAALRAAMAELGSVGELTGVLEVAFGQRNQIDAAVSGVVGALDRAARQVADEGTATRSPSCASWLARTLHVSPGAAQAQVRLARQLRSLPATADAFERGEISLQHASVVASSVEHVERGGGDTGMAEDLLLLEAERRHPRDLFRWGLSLVHQMAPAEMEAGEEQRQRRSSLWLAEVFGGGYEIAGYLDPICGSKLKVALDGLMGPRAANDARTPGQRRARALEDLADLALGSGRLPPDGGHRPRLTVTASVETLRGDPGAPAAQLAGGFPISGRALRAIANDTGITSVLLSPEGEPPQGGRRHDGGPSRGHPGRLERRPGRQYAIDPPAERPGSVRAPPPS